MKLSIIVHGRNDSYFQNFLWRIQTTLNRIGLSLAALPDKHFAEIILCDWGSTLKERLIDNLDLNNECLSRLRYLYVHPTITKLAERDSQYSSSHACNTAMRRAKGDFVSFYDSDVYITEVTMLSLCNAINLGILNGHDMSKSFYWATRYHIPQKFCITNPTISEIDNYIKINDLYSDTPTGEFGGAVCAQLLPREIWNSCGGLDERLIYWGVTDIDIHKRLCMRHNYGGTINTPDIKFYHLEHYQTRAIDNPELTRKRNIYIAPTEYNPNGNNWGLPGLDFETEKVCQKPQIDKKSKLVDLYNEIMDIHPYPYDGRLIPAMTEDKYYEYQNNIGHTYYLFLNKLVHKLKPKKILELGTSIGRSALFMMVALPEDSTLTTIDIGSYQRTDLAGFAYDDRLKVIFGSDLDQKVVDDVGSGFDLLFIDSEHNFDQVSCEWQIYQNKLVDGAIVVMDDIHLNDQMERFWDSLLYEKVDMSKDIHFSGFGMFRYSHRLPGYTRTKQT